MSRSTLVVIGIDEVLLYFYSTHNATQQGPFAERVALTAAPKMA